MSLQLLLLLLAPGAPPILGGADASLPHVLTVVNPRPAMKAASADADVAAPRLFCDLSAFNTSACIASGDDNCQLLDGACLTADEIAQQGANASFAHASLVARWAARESDPLTGGASSSAARTAALSPRSNAGGRNVSQLGAVAHGLVQAALDISLGCSGGVCTASASMNPCGYIVSSMYCPISLAASVHPCATPGYATLDFDAPGTYYDYTLRVDFEAEFLMPPLVTFTETDALSLAIPYLGRVIGKVVDWFIPSGTATASLYPISSMHSQAACSRSRSRGIFGSQFESSLERSTARTGHMVRSG
ncbi:hypothetical protein T492DRAFT_947752 [Pavlovales sp. CCMP2436]|nr:hypothetical protein T492DRAFT_947752 [Pavlovales sp. CCMP2436]